MRPIRADARARLIAALARGRRWFAELASANGGDGRDNRRPRALQRAQSQHDGLAGLPGSGSRQGRHRRAAAAGSRLARHRPPRRPAARVVRAAQSTGAGRPIGSYRTASPSNSVSVSGKRRFHAGDKHAQNPLLATFRACRDRRVLRTGCQMRRHSPTPGKSLRCRNGWWAHKDSNLGPAD